MGILIGISTFRSEQNSLAYLDELMPDILISSGGALVKYGTDYIYKAEFTRAETNAMIEMARSVCGSDCEITIDTVDAHYWNYKVDPKELDQSDRGVENKGKIWKIKGIVFDRMGDKGMNYFIEGIQGSGKSTLVEKMSKRYLGCTVFREGDYSPVELAWCAYVTKGRYAEILDQYHSIRDLIEENSYAEGDHRVICYTKVITDLPGFHKDLEQ